MHVAVNHIYAIIIGHDTSIPPSHKKKWLNKALKISLCLIIAILPVIAAFAVSNLDYVLAYTGQAEFCITLLFPTALQLRSIFICKKAFSPPRLHEEEKQLLLSNDHHKDCSKKKSFLPKFLKTNSQLYMTPFSSHVFSHPIAVVIVGMLGVFFFLLGFVSWFVNPPLVTCPLYYENKV